jgi:hypothetical protein
MKKSLLFIASFLFIAMFFSTNANSQSLEIYSQELVDNGSTTNPIVFHAGIKNTTDQQRNIKIDVNFIDVVAGHQIECCAGIMCYPPKTASFTLDGLPPLAANSSTEPNFLEAKLLHDGIIGTSKVEFVIYLSDNPDDKVSVTVDFMVGEDVKSLEIFNQEIVDNGSKTEPIKFYAGIMNKTNETKNIKIGVDFVKLVSGHSMECCAGIMCYPPKTEDFVLDGLPPLAANSSTEDNFIEAKLLHNGEEGTSTFDFNFFVSENPDDNVKVTVDFNVGVTGVNELKNFVYYLSEPYPNPATEMFHISYGLPINAVNASLDIYDLNGNRISTYQLQSGSSLLSIITSDMPAGKYFYNIQSNGHILESNSIVVGH